VKRHVNKVAPVWPVGEEYRPAISLSLVIIHLLSNFAQPVVRRESVDGSEPGAGQLLERVIEELCAFHAGAIVCSNNFQFSVNGQLRSMPMVETFTFPIFA
jgi:hypothetical protein